MEIADQSDLIKTPIDEHHRIQAQSPYSASKISADLFLESYVKSYNLPAVILRPFNTYGPRQSERAIIPTIINQILEGTSEIINLGNTNPTRGLRFTESGHSSKDPLSC